MARKIYLITLSSKLDREQVLSHLSKHFGHSYWFYNMPNSFFFKTTNTAKEISAAISDKFGKKRHFVTEIGANREGLLPKDHWAQFYKN